MSERRSGDHGPARAAGILRVAIDATPLLGRPTGVGAFCAGVLGRLAEDPDLSILAYALSWRGRNGLAGVVPPSVEVGRRPMPAGALQRAWGRSSRPAARWFLGRPDVVHGTNFVVPPAPGAAEVVTVFDLTPVRYPELCNAATLQFPTLIRRAVARGAWVHTLSEFVAGEIAGTLDVVPERIRVVPPGVPGVADGQPSGPGRAPAELPIDLPGGTRRYVLAIGTIEPRKDYPSLVAAFAEVARTHPDVALVIVGAEGWGTAALDRALASSPHRDRIWRIGWLGGPDLDRVLAGASVLAYPSVYEGFGFPPLQAMAAGVPVVATRAGAVPEAVGDGAVLVDPGDVDGLSNALGRVLDDEALVADLVRRGHEQVGRLSWKDCATGLADLYRDAAAGR